MVVYQEPTEISKQPIRTRYLGHVTGYQPIRNQEFLIRVCMRPITTVLARSACRTERSENWRFTSIPVNQGPTVFSSTESDGASFSRMNIIISSRNNGIDLEDYNCLEHNIKRALSGQKGLPGPRFVFEIYSRTPINSILYFYQSQGKFYRPTCVAEEQFLEEVRFFKLENHYKRVSHCLCVTCDFGPRVNPTRLMFHCSKSYQSSVSSHPKSQVTQRQWDTLFVDNVDDDEKKVTETTKKSALQRVWDFFEEPDSSKAARVWAVLDVVAITIAVAMFIVETIPVIKADIESKTTNSRQVTFFIIETSCIIFFTIELIARFISCPEKVLFLRTAMNWIDFVTIIPYYIQLSAENESAQALVVLRVLRVIRVLKLARHSKGIIIVTKTLAASVNELALLLFFWFIGVIIFGSIMYYLEYDEDSEFTSILQHPSLSYILSILHFFNCSPPKVVRGFVLRVYNISKFQLLVGGSYNVNCWLWRHGTQNSPRKVNSLRLYDVLDDRHSPTSDRYCQQVYQGVRQIQFDFQSMKWTLKIELVEAACWKRDVVSVGIPRSLSGPSQKYPYSSVVSLASTYRGRWVSSIWEEPVGWGRGEHPEKKVNYVPATTKGERLLSTKSGCPLNRGLETSLTLSLAHLNNTRDVCAAVSSMSPSIEMSFPKQVKLKGGIKRLTLLKRKRDMIYPTRKFQVSISSGGGVMTVRNFTKHNLTTVGPRFSAPRFSDTPLNRVWSRSFSPYLPLVTTLTSALALLTICFVQTERAICRQNLATNYTGNGELEPNIIHYCPILIRSTLTLKMKVQEPTETTKQPIRTRYLGHVSAIKRDKPKNYFPLPGISRTLLTRICQIARGLRKTQFHWNALQSPHARHPATRGLKGKPRAELRTIENNFARGIPSRPFILKGLQRMPNNFIEFVTRKSIFEGGTPAGVFFWEFDMGSPDIPGTPIYRAKSFPPSIPVNRGPTVVNFFVDLSSPCKQLHSDLQGCSRVGINWGERSRGKTEGTKVFSDLELVGVGAGIKSLSHLKRSREKTEGTRVISVLELVGKRSREKTEGTRVISVLELVGVGTKIKFLSHLLTPGLRPGVRADRQGILTSSGERVLVTKSGWPLNRGKILLNPISGENYTVTKSGRTPIDQDARGKGFCPFFLPVNRGSGKSGPGKSGSDSDASRDLGTEFGWPTVIISQLEMIIQQLYFEMIIQDCNSWSSRDFSLCVIPLSGSNLLLVLIHTHNQVPGSIAGQTRSTRYLKLFFNQLWVKTGRFPAPRRVEPKQTTLKKHSAAQIYPGIYFFSVVCLGSTRRGAGKRPVLTHSSTRQKILKKCLKFLKNRKNTIKEKKVLGILWTFKEKKVLGILWTFKEKKVLGILWTFKEKKVLGILWTFKEKKVLGILWTFKEKNIQDDWFSVRNSMKHVLRPKYSCITLLAKKKRIGAKTKVHSHPLNLFKLMTSDSFAPPRCKLFFPCPGGCRRHPPGCLFALQKGIAGLGFENDIYGLFRNIQDDWFSVRNSMKHVLRPKYSCITLLKLLLLSDFKSDVLAYLFDLVWQDLLPSLIFGPRFTGKLGKRYRPNQEILVPDWLITSHVTSSINWLFTCFGRIFTLKVGEVLFDQIIRGYTGSLNRVVTQL
eukprot:sb/3460785/